MQTFCLGDQLLSAHWVTSRLIVLLKSGSTYMLLKNIEPCLHIASVFPALPLLVQLHLSLFSTCFFLHSSSTYYLVSSLVISWVLISIRQEEVESSNDFCMDQSHKVNIEDNKVANVTWLELDVFIMLCATWKIPCAKLCIAQKAEFWSGPSCRTERICPTKSWCGTARLTPNEVCHLLQEVGF